MNWNQIHDDALKAARAIAEKAQSESGRNLTAYEAKAFDEHMAKVEEAKAKLKEIAVSDARYKALAAIPGRGSAKAGDVLSFKGLAGQLKRQMRDDMRGFGVKALIAAGSQVTPAQTLTSPVAMQQPATGLLDLLPVRLVEDTDEYTYLTQTTRTNNAAPVAAGAVKPTSVYTLTRVSRKLEVLAHLTEPIPTYFLADEPSLEQFITGELAFGLQQAVEYQLLNGNGESPNLLGLLEVPGIQTQAFNTSQIRTVRSAITKVEALGYLASGLALHPLDWESIETAADGEDRFLMTPEGSPIDRAQRRLWGVPVALTTQVDQGSGVLLSDGAAAIVADPNLNMQWGTSGDDFTRNLVRARFEGRFGVEVFRASGVVDIALADDEEPGGEG